MRLLVFINFFLITVAAGIFLVGVFATQNNLSPSAPTTAYTLKTTIESSPPATLLFVGDIMLERGVAWAVQKYGGRDPLYPFLRTADFLRSADLTFGNLEGPISERGTRLGSIYSFRFPSGSGEALALAGFDVLSLANNHIWDYGAEALEDTIDILRLNKIAFVGAGRNYEEANRPHVAEVNGTKIAFLAYTNLYPVSLVASLERPGVSDPELEFIKSTIRNLKSEVDIIIVSWHWGGEYKQNASEEQRRIARELIGSGADLIVGHHPHVVQEVERIGSGWAAYSLGNFVFDQSFSPQTRRGLMLKVTLRDQKITSVEPIPIRISDTFQPFIDAASIP